ncbi:hypothetical protein H8E52_12565 [bacterium]|nr:hypothetical protein [bacterium]
MGIDYVLPHPCQNREELGEDGLRRWTFLYMVHKYLRANPDMPGAVSERWKMPVTRGLSQERQEFGRADVDKVGLQIGTLIKRCADCPANLDPKADEFGCVGRINYPLQSRFEEFLADSIQKIMDRLEAEEWPTLLALIMRRDSPFDGKPVARLRLLASAGRGKVLERDEAVNFHRIGDGLSTDSIIHALMGLPHSRKDTTYGREIPREMVPVYQEFLGGLLYGSFADEKISSFSRSSSTYLQFRWFHQALKLAAKLELPLWMS